MMPAASTCKNISVAGSKPISEPAKPGAPQTRNRRRLSDCINPKGRKIKLDRRDPNRDRRNSDASAYQGPARRETIDQRENLRDRRDNN